MARFQVMATPALNLCFPPPTDGPGRWRCQGARPPHPATLPLYVTQQHSRKSQCQRLSPSVTDFLWLWPTLDASRPLPTAPPPRATEPGSPVLIRGSHSQEANPLKWYVYLSDRGCQGPSPGSFCCSPGKSLTGCLLTHSWRSEGKGQRPRSSLFRSRGAGVAS